MGVSNLNPLKRWVLTNKYYIKCNETKDKKSQATHFLLDGGIWKIPKEEYLEFLRLLSVDLQNNEKHYLSENRTEIFKFICDLDFYEKDTFSINEILPVIDSVVQEYFGESKLIVCTSDTKQVTIEDNVYTKYGFHIVYPKLWLTVKTAKILRVLFIERLILQFGERDQVNPWSDVVDLAVYEDNGLRMVGCRKMGICKTCKNKRELREACTVCQGIGKIDENRVYRPTMVLNANDEYLKSIQDFYVMLLETSIYNYNNFTESAILKELPEIQIETKAKKKKIVTSPEDQLVVKVENFIKKNYKASHPKIKIKKLNKVENCYYAEPDDNFCINVNRNHTSSGIYFQIKSTGIQQRCYCKKDTLAGRLYGLCHDFASPEIPITKILSKLLFGETQKQEKKSIVNMKITKNQNQSSLDLSVSVLDNYKENLHLNKEVCLTNCKTILDQIKNELINLTKEK
jgi:hypothetical protein